MPVPPTAPKERTSSPARRSRRCRRFAAVLLVALGLATAESASAKPKTAPEKRLDLAELGFPGISPNVLAQGASLLTVHFADNEHLLVTYSLRGLVPRMVDDRAGDEDRIVAAVLVNIASGKIIARTQWRLHDRGHYLWSLGHGRFLIRIQDALSTFAPMPNFAEGRGFERTVFPPTLGNIDAVLVSSDNQFVTVETSHPRPQSDAAAEAASLAAATRPRFAKDAHIIPLPPPPAPARRAPTASAAPAAEVLHFFRISGEGSFNSPIEAKPAGIMGVAAAASLPVYSDGYLRPINQSRHEWNVAFHPYGGKDIPLAPIETSCSPNMYRVGPSQFASLNCHAVTGSVFLATYDFARHEMWEEPLVDSASVPVYAVSAESGRFAISRIEGDETAAGAGFPTNTAANQDAFGPTQTVRIYQTQTGDQLLKIDCDPVIKTSENFDLAPNGLRAAVVRGGGIEIYHLPNLTRLDHEDLAELARLAPPPSRSNVDIRGVIGSAEVSTPPPDAPATIILGDAPNRSAPPSILNQGEKPDFKDPASNNEPTPRSK